MRGTPRLGHMSSVRRSAVSMLRRCTELCSRVKGACCQRHTLVRPRQILPGEDAPPCVGFVVSGSVD